MTGAGSTLVYRPPQILLRKGVIDFCGIRARSILTHQKAVSLLITVHNLVYSDSNFPDLSLSLIVIYVEFI